MKDDIADHAHWEAFCDFHLANPYVYDHLVSLARQAKATGRDRVGIRMLWEKLRWDLTIEIEAPDDFKLNDHFHSLYARMVMELESDLEGVFEIRTLRA